MKGFKEIALELAGPGQKAAATPARRDEPDIHAAMSTTAIQDRNARGNLSTYGGDNAIDYVAESIDLIAQTAGAAEWHVERDGQILVPKRAPTQSADEVEEAPTDLVNLLARPNPWQGWSEFVELLVMDFLLAGNGYWLKYRPVAGKPLSLYRLHPEKVKVFAGDKKLVDHYEYSPGGSKEPLRYSPDQVVHFRRTNPHDEHIGLGIISAGPRIFDIELAMTDSMNSYYANGTRLSGVLESERPLPASIFAKIRNQIATLYSGARNSYQVPILENGLKWKTVSATAAEAEYRYLAPQSRDRILALLRVPRALLSADSNDRSGAREAQRTFDNKTMRPFLDRLGECITIGLTQPGWGLDFKIDYEYVMPIEDRLDLGQAFGSLPGVTVAEVREQVGLAPLGPDKKDDAGHVIDEIVLNLPGQNDNASKIKDRPLGSEPGRPPLGENTGSFNADSQDADAEVR